MTTTNVLALFDILQDKYGAPYFPDDWKVRLFNQCQYTYLNDLFPDNQGGRVNVEQDSNTLSNVKPLIYTISVTQNSSGLLTNAAINTAIQAASGDANAKLFRVLGVGFTDSDGDQEIRWMKHNNKWSFKTNSFKTPRYPDKVRYTIEATGLQIYPAFTTPVVSITTIKTPKDIAVGPNVDPEFEDYVVYSIIAKMLKLSGVPVGDDQLIEDVRVAAVSQ